jgi:hypothetical protein
MKQYIAVIGLYNETTTEQISLKEIVVSAANGYQAHKEALFKCNVQEEHQVLRIFDANKNLVFDFKTGFTTS